MAVAAPGRRADGDEHRVGVAHRVGEIGREGEAAGRDVVGHQLVEAGLVDRDLALAQARDLAGILVDADHVVAELGEAGAGHQADIARPDHGDTHRFSLSAGARAAPAFLAAVSARLSATATLASRKPSRLPQS